MKELDDLAEKFVQTPKRRQEILEETEAIIEKIEDANVNNSFNYRLLSNKFF